MRCASARVLRRAGMTLRLCRPTARRVFDAGQSRDPGEHGDHRGEGDVRDERAGRGRQHADADHRHRIAGEQRDEIARHHFAALIRRRDAVDHFEAAAIAQPAGDAAERGGEQQQRHRSGKLGADQKPHRRHQQRQRAEHGGLAAEPRGRKNRDRGNAEHLAHDGAGHRGRGLMQAFGEQVRDQGGVEADQRKRGEAAHRGRHELEPNGPRHAEPRPQRCFAETFRVRDRFRHEQDGDGDSAEQNQIDEIRQPQRPRRELSEQAAEQRPRGAAEKIRRRRDPRRGAVAAAGVELGDPRGRGACAQAGRETAERPRREQPGRARRRGEHNRAGDADADRRQDRAAAADLVGEPSEEQQRHEIAEHIDRIDQGQRDAGESERPLVERIKRRRHDGADEHHRERDGDDCQRDDIARPIGFNVVQGE